jgi:hypothetical protein
MTMAREDYESVGEIVYELINPVLNRLLAIREDHQWLLPEKRAAVGRLHAAIDAAWKVYWTELHGDNGPTPANERGEVRHDIA